LQRNESYILDLLTRWQCCHKQCKNFICICYHQDINHSYKAIKLKIIWYWITAIMRDDEEIDCNNSSFNLVIEWLHSFARNENSFVKSKSSSSSQFIARSLFKVSIVYNVTLSSMLSSRSTSAATSDSLIYTL
jgi:hypothetical protein